MKTELPWKVEYDNETGLGDESFVEWFTVGPAKIEFHGGQQTEARSVATRIALAVNFHQHLVDALRDIAGGTYSHDACVNGRALLAEIEKEAHG